MRPGPAKNEAEAEVDEGGRVAEDAAAIVEGVGEAGAIELPSIPIKTVPILINSWSS